MREKGQSLLELVVVIAISVILITAITKLSTVSVKNSTSSQDKAAAVRYAQEAIEWLRGERDNSWATFFGNSTTGGSTWCLNALSWNSGACGALEIITATNFKRQVLLTRKDLDSSVAGYETVEAAITVSWPDGSGTRQTVITTQFTDWRN